MEYWWFSLLGECGSEYTEPKNLVWLTDVGGSECDAGEPCSYIIEAPVGTVVLLNFTSLSGLEYPERNSTQDVVYDLIEGASDCRPKIEVTLTMILGGDNAIRRFVITLNDRWSLVHISLGVIWSFDHMAWAHNCVTGELVNQWASQSVSHIVVKHRNVVTKNKICDCSVLFVVAVN